ncbi:hypothetical protein DMH04_01195 [Kibdelosporangium aridum]|uniref:NADH:quinone oxidoreductase/Mrp antiporter transmembrane domain-containing protein n=1 Tax=Kibdelosporangium aridum TaxID=2030 RepID=A0A428ZV03_KIBAR|nr:hypothetical protein DMH04_01195 [Kibdelosporangium aridum]
MLAACLVLAFGRLLPRRLIDLVALVAVAGCLANAVVLLGSAGVTWIGGWRVVGIAFVVDGVSGGLTLLIALLTLCALLFAWGYFDTVEAHFPVLILLFQAGMTGFVLVGDLFTMFVCFELMGAVGYALTGYKVEEPDSVQGAFTFGVINSLGAYLGLTGIALLYAKTGQLGLAQMGVALAGHPADRVVVVGFALVCVAWLVKAAAAPFHFWLADAHAVAPTPVCLLFSGVMAPLGIYGVARISSAVFGPLVPAVHTVFLILGVFTAAVGAVMAFTQRHLKRMLAYSTIAHSGLFLVALSSGNVEGIAGAALYLIGHAGAKGALFLLTGLLLGFHGSVDENGLFGKATRHRVLGVLFVLAASALAGLPPFVSGIGKSLAEESTHSIPLIVLFIVVSAVTAGAVLRAGLRIFWGVGKPAGSDQEVTSGEHELPESDRPFRRTPMTAFAAIVILIGLSLATGVIPAVTEAVGRAAAEFGSSAGYLALVLGVGPEPDAAVPEVHWHGSSLLLSALTVGTAAVVALVALHFKPRQPGKAIAVLHRVHSGRVGDYAAWLVVGTLLFAGTLLVAG